MSDPKQTRDFSAKLENLRQSLSEFFTSVQVSQSNVRNTTWTPIFSAIEDNGRVVLKIVDWVGCNTQTPGTTMSGPNAQCKPPVNVYIGQDGLTPHLSEAVDFRGMPGPPIDIPVLYGVPYVTGERIGERRVMACRVWCGTLPNNTSKSVALPAAVADVMEKHNTWIDIGNSYTYNPIAEVNWPLTATAWGNGGGNNLQHRVTVGLSGDSIMLNTTGNLFPDTGNSWSDFTQTIVVVKYLEQPVA